MQGCMQSGRRGLEHDDLSPLGEEGLQEAGGCFS